MDIIGTVKQETTADDVLLLFLVKAEKHVLLLSLNYSNYIIILYNFR